jgi:hypothetical protein
LCCREGLPAGPVNKGINMSVFALVVSIESDYPNALFAVPFFSSVNTAMDILFS